MWNKKLELYDKLVSLNPALERKGKTMPYTSVNGHMFSQLNKDGDIGIRLSKEDRDYFIKKYKAELFTAYGAVMKEYVLVPEEMLKDLKSLLVYLNKGYEYVKSLKPEATK